MTSGWPLALALILVTLVIGLWKRTRVDKNTGQKIPRLPRLVAFFTFAAAGLLVIGFGPWREALATWTYSGPGLLVLGLVDILMILVGLYEVVIKDGYHRLHTNIAGAVAGTAAVVTAGDFWRMMHKAGRLIPKTADAAAKTYNEFASGKAHHAGTHLPGLNSQVIGAVIAIAAAAIALFVALEGRKVVANARTRQRSSARGLPAGGGRRGLPTGQG